MSSSALPKEICQRIESEVESLGYECIELSMASESGRRILRVRIDSTAGVTLDQCASVSRALGAALEDLAGVEGRYYLEVSSPGINRPLTKPDHFRRFLGERVKIRLREKLDGGLTVTGVLAQLENDVLTVETTVGPKQVPLSNIARARLHRNLDDILKASR